MNMRLRIRTSSGFIAARRLLESLSQTGELTIGRTIAECHCRPLAIGQEPRERPVRHAAALRARDVIRKPEMNAKQDANHDHLDVPRSPPATSRRSSTSPY